MTVSAGFLVPHPPMIVPEVGGGKEEKIAGTIRAYHGVARQVAALSPDVVIIFTPHSTLYSDYIHISPGESASGSLSRFGAPALYEVSYDSALVRRVEALCEAARLPAGTLGERDSELDHGVLVPLHFLRELSDSFKLMRVSPSGLSREEHYRFGMMLAQAIRELGRNAVIIASGDLSHKLTNDGPYGYAPEGPRLDAELIDIMDSGDFGKLFELDEALCEKGAECGLLPFIMLAGAFDSREVNAKLLSYEGPFGVGYAVAAFAAGNEDASRGFLSRRIERGRDELKRRRNAEDDYVRLARSALESYVLSGELPPLPEGLPDELVNRRAGAFVSIKKQGQLRGCIGTTSPTQQCVAEEIRRCAVSSGTQDPRFSPVTSWELDELVYSVDILSPAEPAERETLDPKRYGVIVQSGHKSGLLLPNLDGVDTVEEQISIACQKAGIARTKPYTIQRFEVVRHN